MEYRTKLEIIDEIRKNVDVFYPVPPIRCRIRCPICGDSQTDLKDAHCYIKYSDDPNEPLLYKCFRANCRAKGKVDKQFLDKLNIKSDVSNKVENQRYNRLPSLRKVDVNIITGTPVLDSPQVRYIEHRLGKGFTIEDLDRFKIIWDIHLIHPYVTEKVRNTLPSNRDSISFISDDKSMLLIRSMIEGGKWRKVPLVKSDNRSYYAIKVTLDLFTKDPLIVNIAEGIFDILSVYKNFNDSPNSVFIAALGGDYIDGIEYAIMKGFIGSNIIIRLYIDSNINQRIIKQKLRRYKWIFNKIVVYQNIRADDVGHKIEDIELSELNV